MFGVGDWGCEDIMNLIEMFRNVGVVWMVCDGSLLLIWKCYVIVVVCLVILGLLGDVYYVLFVLY